MPAPSSILFCFRTGTREQGIGRAAAKQSRKQKAADHRSQRIMMQAIVITEFLSWSVPQDRASYLSGAISICFSMPLVAPAPESFVEQQARVAATQPEHV